MTGREGFHLAEDPLAAAVFDAPSDLSPAAACRGVGKTYRTATESVTALDEVTLAISRARVTVVGGPSGSGKSSLLRLLACIDSPDRGEVHVAGQRVDRLRARARRRLRRRAGAPPFPRARGGPRARRRLRRRQVAYLFQRPGENLLPYLDAVGQVRLAAQLRGAPVSA